MHRGYIKLWRRLQDSFLWTDAGALQVWVHLLLGANYKDTQFMFNGKKQLLKRGQLITGRKKLSTATGLSENKIYRTMNMLESEQLIEQQKFNLFTLVSIVKYDEYQSFEQLNEQQIDNQSTTNRQPVDTSKELRRIKESKYPAPNNISQTQLDEFNTVWAVYPNKIGREAALKKFLLQVKTKEDYDLLVKGIENYKKDIEDKQTDKRYIKHGSAFFNSVWRDWAVMESVDDLGYGSNGLRMG